MKLYTEEQVKIAYSKGNNDGYCGIQRDFEALNLMSIELPSDEEIEEQSKKWVLGSQVWEKGAKWMKEQIFNQNNK